MGLVDRPGPWRGSTLAEAPQAPLTAPPLGLAAPEGDENDGPQPPKPDVFEYFAQRATRQRELEQEVERLKLREASFTRKLQDCELLTSRLKSEMAGAAARHEAREAQLQLQRQQAEARLAKEIEHSATLEVQLRAPKDDGGQQQAATNPQGNSISGVREAAAAQEEVRQLKLKASELEMALETAKAEAEESASRAAVELEAERRLRAAEADTAAELREQLAGLQDAADAAAAARRDAEARCAALEAAAFAAQAQVPSARSSEGEAVLLRSLREQLKVAQAEAAEAAALRVQAAERRVLKERLEAAESRARRSEQLLEAEHAVHAELATAQSELERWSAVLSGVADCSTPEDVLRLVKRLQDRELAAAAGTGDMAEQLASVKADLDAATAALKEAQTEAQAEHARAEAATAASLRSGRHVELLAKEKDSLKAVLASYEEEYLAQSGTGALPSAQGRIAELESTIEGLHAHIASLEAELGSGSAAQAGSADALAQAEARAEVAEAKIKSLETEVENLGRQVACLEERVGRGEFNPATTRVLHLRANPEAELERTAREARVAELESENAALRENIQRIEATAAGGASGSGGGSLKIAQLEGEANLLRRRLAEGQKSADRLQQVFMRQIAAFREAISALFGYRVEMSSDPGARDHRGQFRLRPQYADEPGAELLFHMQRDGRMVLVPTPYSSQRLAREVDTFITRFKSIPAFTANLTMETFQRHTQG